MPTTVAITGAAGRIGTAVRAGLSRDRYRIRAIDSVGVDDAAPGDEVVVADLRDPDATLAALKGADAVVHLAARPNEASFTEILDSNVRTTAHVYEAARQVGVRRVVFASSMHVSGFYPWGRTTAPGDAVRPDTYYGLSKVYGEGLGQLYADRFGLEVVNLRIGGFGPEPLQPAYLWVWLSHGDTVRLVDAALGAPVAGVLTCYGVSRNTRGFYTEDGWDLLGYDPQDDAERFADRWPDAQPPEFQGMDFTASGYLGG